MRLPKPNPRNRTLANTIPTSKINTDAKIRRLKLLFNFHNLFNHQSISLPVMMFSVYDITTTGRPLNIRFLVVRRIAIFMSDFVVGARPGSYECLRDKRVYASAVTSSKSY